MTTLTQLATGSDAEAAATPAAIVRTVVEADAAPAPRATTMPARTTVPPLQPASRPPGSLPAPAPAPVGSPPPRRPRVRVWQPISWQLAAAAVAAQWRADRTSLAVASAIAVVVLGLTATWSGDCWTYQWLRHGLVFVLRRRRFRPLAARLDSVIVGGSTAATLSDPAGVTVVLCCSGPVDRADVIDEATDIHARLLLHRGTRWLALTAKRTPTLSTDDDLALVLGNAVRRVRKRLGRRGVEAAGLTPDELASLWASLTPPSAVECWDALRLGAGRYRVVRAPATDPPAAAGVPGVVTVTAADDQPGAVILLAADAPRPPDWTVLAGRQRTAFLAALPGGS